ncbi:Hypothetical predicted protein [Paramuricea clavata]|uniref:Uncharacterized protein n=1 Tax=Paramuricea clavata TaxID=317549 RepID=A0A7D9JN81_PARCT|nr:Hypothetical predicted protein [Paramuricea clavata]
MGIFPSEWKIARVIPLQKKGSRSVLDNYGPISILPVISKIFEKILYEQLYEYFTTNNLLSEQQFGFRRFHSTSTALLDCTDEWYVNMDRGLYNLAVFLDLKKAFDTVNHDILLAKLELYGIKNTPLMLLKSYLSDRSQKCQVNGELSTLKYLKYGVPQGSILGPLLFLIYINDLPNCLQHSTARMFADDTNITVSGKSIKEAEVAVNVDLNNIREWLLSNRLSLNLVKTEYLLIGSRHNINTLEEQPRVFIGDEPIKGVQVTKTLGVKIDQFLTWDSHIDQISKKISSGISAMKKIKDFTNSDTLNQISIMPDTVKGLKEANKALRSKIEELKSQLNEVSKKITSHTNKKLAIEDQPQVMSNDQNKAVEFIGKQYDDLDAFRKQATQDIKKISSRLDKVSRSCDEIYEAIEAIETYSYQYNIKIVGLPPVNDKESSDVTAALCVKLFSALGVNDVSLQDIDTAHRVPKRNRNLPASPAQ